MIDTSEIGSEVFIGIEAKGLSSRYLSSVYTSDLHACMSEPVFLLQLAPRRFRVVINNCWATPTPYSTDKKRWSLIINR